MFGCRTPASDCATPFHVSVRFWTKAERAPECATVVVVVNDTGPKPNQPVVFCSKPGFVIRFVVWAEAKKGASRLRASVSNNFTRPSSTTAPGRSILINTAAKARCQLLPPKVSCFNPDFAFDFWQFSESFDVAESMT